MKRRPTNFASGRASSSVRLIPGMWTSALILALGMLLSSTTASAQAVTNGTGGGAWASASTWVGGQIPTSGTNVTIAAGDSVWTTIGALVTCNSLDVQSNAKLNAIGSGIQISGDFTMGAGALYINNTDSAKAWPSGGTSYTIDPTSTFELGNGGNSTLGWNESDSTFGNVVIDPNAAGGITCGASLTIKGNLTINAGSGKVFRGISAGVSTSVGATSFVQHVMGNVKVITGNWSAVDMGVDATVPLSCTWNVDGNVTVGDASTTGARFSPITSEDDLGATGIFNIKGNLSFINGARLAAGSNTGTSQSPNQIAAVYVGGNLTFDSTATFAGNSNGNLIINFVGTKPQTVTLGTNVSFSRSSGSPQPSLWDTVATGANVTVTGGHYWRTLMTVAPNGPGAFVINGTLNIDGADTIKGYQKFVVNSGATLGVGAPDGITASSDATPNTGNIQVDSARVFSAGANYVYNGTAAQSTGSGLPSTVNDLTIDNSAGVTLSQATTINGTLDLKAGVFDNTIPFTLGPNGKVVTEGGSLKIPTAVETVVPTVPKQFSLDQNYPNPFNPSTQIKYDLPKAAFVTLRVYNAIGQEVATLVNGHQNAGYYNLSFNMDRFSSGVYFYILRAGNFMSSRKMMLLK